LVDRRHLAPGVAAFVVASLVTLLGLRATANPPDTPRTGRAHIQLLGVNDLHGYLEPTDGLGGAAWLADAMNRAAARHPDSTIRVHAGDRPLDPDRLYTVAANELIATGDRFSVMQDHGQDKQTVGTDAQALSTYLQRRPGALG
jgi:2',3'-cyclic-nucleotide 2'-phosphodiesterase (5'-nucleotidase family)